MVVRSLLLLFFLPVTWSRVRCYSIFDCELKVRPGSECIDGYCSNPYYSGGCLANQLRTCTSEDPPEAAELGYCRNSPMDYAEIRIFSQNWESVFFSAWILQILLSEVLAIPVTIETGEAGKNVNFYDINTSFDYGKSNVWDSLETSVLVKDCRKVSNHPDAAPEDYVACAHFIPEVWTGYEHQVRVLKERAVVEETVALGALAGNSWFVPLYTIRRDPSLATYVGLQGEQNRQKLARTFLRPTTWDDYCLYESKDNCQTPDSVATRPPKDDEKGLYYDGLDSYTGFFRNTTHNDCVKWPMNCTGHIVDYPCGWTSFVSQQSYHNHIAVESNGNELNSNGYSYGEMTQIWAAANATKSDVLMLWWEPEALYQEYLGTEAEFSKVNLPPPTQVCSENRITSTERCSTDTASRVGNSAGSCADYPHALVKVIASSLLDISQNPTVPQVLHSPAYEVVKNFRITGFELGQIFDYWFAINKDKWNLDPRDAVCQWFVENYDDLTSFVPPTHPRIIEEDDRSYRTPVVYVAFGFSILAMCITLVSMAVTYIQRDKKVIRYSQIEFLYLLLCGLLMVSFGALLGTFSPTNAICISIVWLVNLGYTLELVPLIVKVAAINRLMVAAQQMQRIELSHFSLYGAVAAIALLMCVMLITWTIINPPQKISELLLTDEMTVYGETIVERTHFCESKNEIWEFLTVAWQVLLLVAASILAFQTRNMHRDLNETRTLAILVYSQSVFVVLRAVTQVIDFSLEKSAMSASFSIIYALDILATNCIYFAPKFFMSDGEDTETSILWASQAPGVSESFKRSSLEKKSGENRKPTNRSHGCDSCDLDSTDEENAPSTAFVRPISFAEDTINKTQAEWETTDSDEVGLPVVHEDEGEEDDQMEIVFVDANDGIGVDVDVDFDSNNDEILDT